jgi:signal transduction histidine kinase
MKASDAVPAVAGRDRGDNPEVARREAGGAQPPGGQPAAGTSPGRLFGKRHYRTDASQSRVGPIRALKNWRVRSRLILLVLIPTLTAVLLGGIRIGSSLSSALAYQRVEQLANLSGKITGLVQALQNEREATVQYIILADNGGRTAALAPKTATAGSPPPRYEQQALQQSYGVTSGWANQVTGLLGGVNGSYPELAQQEAQAAATAISGLPALRTEATQTQLPALEVIQEYTNTINTLLALDDQVAVGSNDSTLAGTARVVGLVSAIKEEVSEQQAIITSALSSSLVGINAGAFGPTVQAAITDAEAEQQGNQTEFNTAATTAQRGLFNSALSASTVARAQAQEQEAISLASSGSPIATDPTIVDASTSLYSVVSSLRSVEQQLVGSVIARSTALRNDAILSVILWSIAVLLVLALTLIFMIIIGRSMVRPLRKLRAGALEVAGQRLPETVRQMSETDGEGVPLEVEPIDVDSSDEIGEVARAFDQVHREAIRLAANEAALRGNVNAMFVNLSRRSQSLVERQIRLIDDLEQGEQDPERLSSLFQMDHLATRMRRNSENLLVLAGHEESRRWNEPVALVDVLRAALSEIEQYERVSVNVQPGIAVRGQAVSDVVHLTAELVENATSFSPAETPVTIAGHLLSSGGALLEITDHGVGMEAEEMAHANWRLDNPPVVDVAVSRRMGLFVVARLAARHGIRVRLRPAVSRGLVALVWLPDEAITHRGPGTAADPGGSEPATALTDVAARPAAEVIVAEPRPGPGWATTGPLPGFRTVPRPAEEPEYAPGQTGPNPIVSSDEEPLAEPGDESVDAGSPASAGLDAQITASLPFRTGEADYRSGSRVDDAPDGPDADPWSHAVVPTTSAPPPAPPAPPDPPADPFQVRHRLPIFEKVESDWFRQSVKAVARFGRDQEPVPGVSGWSSPADEGWRAAATVQQPSSGGVTSAGLPKRVPRANLVPGAAGAAEAGAPTAASARSAAETRDRFASFQRGAKRGRAAADGDEAGPGGDDPGHA